MQNAGLAHGPFAVSDLDIIPDDQIMCLQCLKQPNILSVQHRYETNGSNADAHVDIR